MVKRYPVSSSGPTTRGIITAAWSESKGTVQPPGYNDDFCFDPVAGWTAEVHTPTGEGITTARTFTRLRRCVLYGDFPCGSAAEILDAARLYARRSDGIVPKDEMPPALKLAQIARVPPVG